MQPLAQFAHRPSALLLSLLLFEPETLAKLKRGTNAMDGWGFDSHTEERSALRDEFEDAGIEDLGEIRKRLERAYPPYPVNHDQTHSLLHRSATMSTREIGMRFVSAICATPLTCSRFW